MVFAWSPYQKRMIVIKDSHPLDMIRRGTPFHTFGLKGTVTATAVRVNVSFYVTFEWALYWICCWVKRSSYQPICQPMWRKQPHMSSRLPTNRSCSFFCKPVYVGLRIDPTQTFVGRHSRPTVGHHEQTYRKKTATVTVDLSADKLASVNSALGCGQRKRHLPPRAFPPRRAWVTNKIRILYRA